MLKHLGRQTSGDTIIEVLIALSILSFALTTAYSTVNRSMQSARNSQEHSEALQYLNSQVELARAAATNLGLYGPGSFCMDATATRVLLSNAACTTGLQNFYELSIAYAPTPNSYSVNQDIFTFTVKWPGIGQLGPQKEQLSYKIHRP